MQRALAYFAAFTGMGVLFAGTLLLAALVLGAGQTSGAPSGSASPPGSPSAGGPVGTIEIHAFDLGFDPSAVTVAAAGEYTVRFVNTGGILHDLTFADGTVIQAEGGTQATGTVTIPAGGLSFICSVPGHAGAGMEGTVTVAAGHGSHEPSASPAQSMSA
jgi:nitrite reductase (NO-forming)